MPDLLLFAPDNRSCFELEAHASKLGFRVKMSFNLDQAKDWLKLKPFDAALVDASVELARQEELADLLWRNNNAAPFVVFSFVDEPLREKQSIRLFGAETASGPNALQRITEILTPVAPRGAKHPDDFRIMVVEDLDSPRDIICSYLEGLGFPQVEGFESARSALQELERDPTKFSCIITDIRMPEISGDQFIELVRRHTKLSDLPIIALTAHGTLDCLIDCLKAGASGFLVKPPKKKDMSRELWRALRIAAKKGSPRLAQPHEADALREILRDKGMI